MEITSKLKDRETPSPLSSPKPPTTTINGHNGGRNIPITTRSDPNSPYPTTFVTADSSSFKHVVQMLTGDSSPSHSPSRSFAVPPTQLNHHRQPPLMQQQGFKLYERRNRNSNNAAFKNMMIKAHGQNASFSLSPPEILSPSLLDFPALTLSPVTPLTDQDPFDKSSPTVSSSGGGGGGGSSLSVEEERAMAEKGFYLHPSPISTPRDSEPQLLPLFPLSSPRVFDN